MLVFFIHSPPDSVGEGILFSDCPSVGSFVRTDLVTMISHKRLSDFDETHSECSVPTDDLIRFWRSKVTVTAGRRGQIL